MFGLGDLLGRLASNDNATINEPAPTSTIIPPIGKMAVKL